MPAASELPALSPPHAASRTQPNEPSPNQPADASLAKPA